uniref:polyprenyl synthetase family protein n=1 Tax=Eubacterium cellulosolvens TaxID=29322 RepID=UPI0004893A75|nr:farnesyl diphosphate synthase [[Eubacterium] cellulosolvens]
MNFEEEFQKKKAEAEEIIERYLPDEKEVPGKLTEAMNYSMRAGGKRIRPVLMLESYRMCGGDAAVVEPFMAAIEMIHTHSLVHDDLPDLDNDEFRRGKKTTHAAFGPALGVLAGDALLNYAYETAMKAFDCCEDAGTVARALRILAARTGIGGMLGGQSFDVENEKNGVFSLDRETLDYIYVNKTAALLEAPLMIGAILAGADERTVLSMEEIGHKAGLAFQIMDDVLDVTSTLEELGKPIGSDEKNDKTTYVTLMGTGGAREEAGRLTREAVGLLASIEGDHEFLKNLLLFMADRRK